MFQDILLAHTLVRKDAQSSLIPLSQHIRSKTTHEVVLCNWARLRSLRECFNLSKYGVPRQTFEYLFIPMCVRKR